MTLKELVANLEGKLTAAESKILTLEEENHALSEKVGSLEGEHIAMADQVVAANLKIEGFTAQVSTLEAEKITLNGQITKLEGEARGSDVRAQEIAARNGANLPAKVPGAGDKTLSEGGAKTMSRADFTNLSAAERMAFTKGGGRLTEDS